MREEDRMNRRPYRSRSAVPFSRVCRRGVAGLSGALAGLLTLLSTGCMGVETSVEWLLEVEEGWGSSQERRAATVEAVSVLRARIAAFNEGGPMVGSVERVEDSRILVRLSGYGAESANLEPLFRVGNVALHRVREDIDLQARFPGLDSVLDAHAPDVEVPGLGVVIPTEGDTSEPRVRIDTQTTSPERDSLLDTQSLAGRSRGAGSVMIDQPPSGRYPMPVRAALVGPVDDFLLARSQAHRGASAPTLAFAWGQMSSTGRGEPMMWLYVLDAEPMMTSRDVEEAYAADLAGGPGVAFALTPTGAARVADMSERHIGERLAVVVDRRAVADVVIRDRIGKRGKIDAPADISDMELYTLGLFLRAGPLPAPLVVVDRRPSA